MMPPPAYPEARLRALYHLQVEVTEAPNPEQTPAPVGVQSVVRRVFRTDGHISVGDAVCFDVWVSGEGDSILDLPLGPLIVMSLRALRNSMYLEVFLNGTPPQCHLAADQCASIYELLDTPHMRVPTEAEVAAAWDEFNQHLASAKRPTHESPVTHGGILSRLRARFRGE